MSSISLFEKIWNKHGYVIQASHPFYWHPRLRKIDLMQFQADILDIPVVRSRAGDLSALGAAYLAGLATGIWKSLDEISKLSRPHDRFEPNMPANRRDALLNGWRDAVSRAHGIAS